MGNLPVDVGHAGLRLLSALCLCLFSFTSFYITYIDAILLLSHILFHVKLLVRCWKGFIPKKEFYVAVCTGMYVISGISACIFEILRRDQWKGTVIHLVYSATCIVY